MKHRNTKKLNRKIHTVCDFNRVQSNGVAAADNTPTGTDPTNTSMTVILTTVNTHVAGRH